MLELLSAPTNENFNFLYLEFLLVIAGKLLTSMMILFSSLVPSILHFRMTLLFVNQ